MGIELRGIPGSSSALRVWAGSSSQLGETGKPYGGDRALQRDLTLKLTGPQRLARSGDKQACGPRPGCEACGQWSGAVHTVGASRSSQGRGSGWAVVSLPRGQCSAEDTCSYELSPHLKPTATRI